MADNVVSVWFWTPGATISLDFTPDFDLQKYQDRLVQDLLSQVCQPAVSVGSNEPVSHRPGLLAARCWWGCLRACSPSDVGGSASPPPTLQGSPPTFGFLDVPAWCGGWRSLLPTTAGVQMGKEAGGGFLETLV